MSHTIKRILAVLAFLVLGVGLVIGNDMLSLRQAQPQMYADPVFETLAPRLDLPQRDFSVLVFSKTNGFRHHEAIPAANALLRQFADQGQWAIAFTENGAVFNTQQLAQFDVVVWNNATGPALTEDQQQAFEAYILAGGGYLGIHAAGDGSHKSWLWYANEVIRSQFTMHPMWPQIQMATLYVEQPQHPVVQDLPTQWQLEDEWYSFQASVRGSGSDVLLGIDENSYDPNIWPMGDDHPLVWAHSVGEGRVLYSALGHLPAVYNDKRYQALLLQGIHWVAGGDEE